MVIILGVVDLEYKNGIGIRLRRIFRVFEFFMGFLGRLFRFSYVWYVYGIVFKCRRWWEGKEII